MFNPANPESQQACWPHPHHDGSIHMSAAVLNSISTEALRWLLSQPPTEIGGLLWGRFEENSVFVEDAEFVFSETAQFNETKSDGRRLAEALVRKHKANLTLVGYFRSHVRPDLSLSERDKKLIESHLTDRRSAFLLVRPYPMGINMAAFFFWENGRLQAEVSDLEVPFVALKREATDSIAERPASVPIAPAKPVEPVVEAPVEPTLTEAESPEPVSSSNRRRTAIYALAASTLLGISAGWLVQHNMRAGQRRVASMAPHLQVTRRIDGQLDFSWNPAFTASARHAAVTIREGTAVRTLSLNRPELQAGKLAYFPQTGDVDFRLDLETDGTPMVSQSLHVVTPDPPTLQTSARQAVYQPPIPVHRVMPNPSLLRPVAFADSSEARIEVQVDAAGRVTGAQLLSQGATAGPELIDSALAAARLWTFKPATLDGKPVAARHTLVFEFDGASR